MSMQSYYSDSKVSVYSGGSDHLRNDMFSTVFFWEGAGRSKYSRAFACSDWAPLADCSWTDRLFFIGHAQTGFGRTGWKLKLRYVFAHIGWFWCVEVEVFDASICLEWGLIHTDADACPLCTAPETHGEPTTYLVAVGAAIKKKHIVFRVESGTRMWLMSGCHLL